MEEWKNNKVKEKKYNIEYNIYQEKDKLDYEIVESYTDDNGNIIEIISDDNHIKYYKNYILHRDNGPAVVYINGDEEWYKEDSLHRENGPAWNWKSCNDISWHYEGKLIDCKSQEEFERIMKLRLFF